MAALLPYTYKVISRTPVSGQPVNAVRINVVDRAGSVRLDETIHVPSAANWAEVQTLIRGQVDRALATDAGSQNAFLDQLITDAETFDLVMLRGARKTANQAESGTSFVNCTDLGFLVAPNSHYKFAFTGAYSAAAATTGLQLSVNGPASPNFLAFVGQIYTSTTASFASAGGSYDVAIASTASGGATVLPFWLEGSISTGAAGGTLQLRMRSEVNGSAVTVNRGSVGELIQVA